MKVHRESVVLERAGDTAPIDFNRGDGEGDDEGYTDATAEVDFGGSDANDVFTNVTDPGAIKTEESKSNYDHGRTAQTSNEENVKPTNETTPHPAENEVQQRQAKMLEQQHAKEEKASQDEKTAKIKEGVLLDGSRMSFCPDSISAASVAALDGSNNSDTDVIVQMEKKVDMEMEDGYDVVDRAHEVTESRYFLLMFWMDASADYNGVVYLFGNFTSHKRLAVTACHF
jgi:hypothetical protein